MNKIRNNLRVINEFKDDELVEKCFEFVEKHNLKDTLFRFRNKDIDLLFSNNSESINFISVVSSDFRSDFVLNIQEAIKYFDFDKCISQAGDKYSRFFFSKIPHLKGILNYYKHAEDTFLIPDHNVWNKSGIPSELIIDVKDL